MTRRQLQKHFSGTGFISTFVHVIYHILCAHKNNIAVSTFRIHKLLIKVLLQISKRLRRATKLRLKWSGKSLQLLIKDQTPIYMPRSFLQKNL
jgi:hypothetical protein